MDEPFSDRWWRLVCATRPIVVGFTALNAVFLFLALVARAFVDPGSSSHFILQLSFAMTVPVLAVCLGLLYGCKRWSATRG